MVSLILIDFAVGNKRIVPPEKHKAVILEAGDGFGTAGSAATLKHSSLERCSRSNKKWRKYKCYGAQ
jgi:hypothetical protein